MKKKFFNALMFITSLLIIYLFPNCPNSVDVEDMEPSGTTEYGYPADFPLLMDTGGKGEGDPLFGFGGLLDEDMQANRDAVQHIPVILLHGMRSTAENMGTLRDFLKEFYPGIPGWEPYNEAEIWAVSYLGHNPTAEYKNVHCKNIDDVRIFIDTVRSYLNVKRVIIIGYSFGAGMARAYLNGLVKDTSESYQSPGYDYFNGRWGKVAAIITLAGANYGLGTERQSFLYREDKIGDFYTGGVYENDTHYFPVSLTFDDTPYGALEGEIDVNYNQAAGDPLPSLKIEGEDDFRYNYADEGGTFGTTTSLDNGSTRVFYGCAQANNDNTVRLDYSSYLQGADLNMGFEVSHSGIINSEQVVKEAIIPILIKANQYYPDNKK